MASYVGDDSMVHLKMTLARLPVVARLAHTIVYLSQYAKGLWTYGM